MKTERLFTIAFIRDLEAQVFNRKITYSRAVEILNEMAVPPSPTVDEKQLTDGFYWIMHIGYWEIGKFRSDTQSWIIIGLDDWIPNDIIEKIGNRIEPVPPSPIDKEKPDFEKMAENYFNNYLAGGTDPHNDSWYKLGYEAGISYAKTFLQERKVQISGLEEELRQAREGLLEKVKDEWIKQFGSLNDDHERNGYFVVGFLNSVLEEIKQLKDLK